MKPIDGTSHVGVRPDASNYAMIPVSSRCLDLLWSLFSVLTLITDSSIVIQRPQKHYSPFYLFFSIEYCPQVVTNYAFESFREDVSVPWLVLLAHEPAESSVDSDLLTNPSHRVVGSNRSTTRARNKPPPDAPHMSEDPGPSDLSSSSYDIASPLHFHGLADTQTQTQVASSAEAPGQGGAMPESRVCIPLIINLALLFPLLDPASADNY
jgi:hypothetical protein